MLGIKESKRSALEQKALREMFMRMAKGEDMDLGGMMEALSGGGDDAPIDPKALQDLMSSMTGGLPEGMPDLDKMSPSDVKNMTKEALQVVKESLADGSISREEILELEKMMGVDLKTLVNMMDKGKVDKAKLQRELGTDMGDIFEVFRQLAKMKE